MSSSPPTKLLTMSPALDAFLMQGLNAQAALACVFSKRELRVARYGMQKEESTFLYNIVKYLHFFRRVFQ